MGIFSDVAEKRELQHQVKQLQLQLHALEQTCEQLQGRNRELEQSNQALVQDNRNKQTAVAELTALTRKSNKPGLGITAITYLVKLVGLGFVAISVFLAYGLASVHTFSFDARIVWAAYLVTQFGGLYLIGYGKEVSTRSILGLGFYTTIVFLCVCATIMLSFLGQIALNISATLFWLGMVNFSGILILVYIERRACRPKALRA